MNLHSNNNTLNSLHLKIKVNTSNNLRLNLHNLRQSQRTVKFLFNLRKTSLNSSNHIRIHLSMSMEPTNNKSSIILRINTERKTLSNSLRLSQTLRHLRLNTTQIIPTSHTEIPIIS